MRGVGALAGAEDAVADLEFVGGGRVHGAVDAGQGRAAGLRVGGRGEDGAGELGAGDPRQGRLVLVFAADLEEVEEIGAAGADLDEVFVGMREWSWEVRDGEVEGPGYVGGYLDGFHGCGGVDGFGWRGRRGGRAKTSVFEGGSFEDRARAQCFM